MSTPHILVPTDLSPASCSAFPHAAGLARALGGHITLIHVDNISNIDLSLWDSSTSRAQLREELEQRRRILKSHQEVLTGMGANVKVDIIAGQPGNALLKYVKQGQVDFIVISKQGSGLLDRLLIGSVTKKLVQRSPVPVLFIEGSPSPTFDKPARYRTILNATDFSEDSRQGLLATLDLATMIDAKVTLTHIVQPPVLGVAPVKLMLPPESTKSVCEYYQGELEQMVHGLPSQRLSLHVEVGLPVAQTIAQLADDWEVDLITVPSHGKGALIGALVGSTTQRLIKLTHRPVLVFPPAYLKTHYGAV